MELIQNLSNKNIREGIGLNNVFYFYKFHRPTSWVIFPIPLFNVDLITIYNFHI
jgi:hypothetical protein